MTTPDGHAVSTAATIALATARPRILVFATQGTGHGEESRIRELLGKFSVDLFPFDRRSKPRMAIELLRAIVRQKPDLVVMEGSGSAGGLAIMLGRILFGTRYVVSSGDAIAPFLRARVPLLSPIFLLYERMLCRLSAGFIGWTPYLVGRALTFGAPRAVTAAGWAPFPLDEQEIAEARRRVRARWGIPDDAIVFGITGTTDWNPRVGYCYGYELVAAAIRVNRPDVRVLIVGDGSGRQRLEQLAGDKLGGSIILTGKVRREEVMPHLAAMDVGSLPQSVDQVGSFRYTTKLSEYMAASLPVVTGRIPVGYDLDTGWIWRLSGSAPWDSKYIACLAELMRCVDTEAVQSKRSAIPLKPKEFDRAGQVDHVTAFIEDVLADVL
jgi:hypothetical protein